MNAEFAARLVRLRKERGINQKQAAAELEVSQALLSHYEKGIRECGLAFLCRCAEFYGVSTDYLLALNSSWQEKDAASMDAQFSPRTVFRSAAILAQGRIEDPVHLSIAILLYKALLVKVEQGKLPPDFLPDRLAGLSAPVCRGLLDGMIEELLREVPAEALAKQEIPGCLETTIQTVNERVASLDFRT